MVSGHDVVKFGVRHGAVQDATSRSFVFANLARWWTEPGHFWLQRAEYPRPPRSRQEFEAYSKVLAPASRESARLPPQDELTVHHLPLFLARWTSREDKPGDDREDKTWGTLTDLHLAFRGDEAAGRQGGESK